MADDPTKQKTPTTTSPRLCGSEQVGGACSSSVGPRGVPSPRDVVTRKSPRERNSPGDKSDAVGGSSDNNCNVAVGSSVVEAPPEEKGEAPEEKAVTGESVSSLEKPVGKIIADPTAVGKTAACLGKTPASPSKTKNTGQKNPASPIKTKNPEYKQSKQLKNLLKEVRQVQEISIGSGGGKKKDKVAGWPEKSALLKAKLKEVKAYAKLLASQRAAKAHSVQAVDRCKMAYGAEVKKVLSTTNLLESVLSIAWFLVIWGSFPTTFV